MALIKPIGWKTGPASSRSGLLTRREGLETQWGSFRHQAGSRDLELGLPTPCMSQASQGGELGSHSQAGIRYSYRAFQKPGFEAMGFRDKDFLSIPFI